MTEGGCLCGAVRYRVEGRTSGIWLCHCSKCRRGSGSAFAASTLCRASAFRWLSGEDRIASWESESGYPSRFCRTCGSLLPLVRAEQGHVVLPAGSLDVPAAPRLLRHIFVGSKAPWWEIHDALPQHEEHVPEEGQAPRSG